MSKIISDSRSIFLTWFRRSEVWVKPCWPERKTRLPADIHSRAGRICAGGNGVKTQAVGLCLSINGLQVE